MSSVEAEARELSFIGGNLTIDVEHGLARTTTTNETPIPEDPSEDDPR